MHADVLDPGHGAADLMLPLLIGAGLGLAGTILANRSSAKQAEANREFQERMSNTAHQREVEDLMRAGINPALSANRGASSPQGAQGEVRDVGEGAARGMASAFQAAQLESVKAQTDLANAQAARERASALQVTIATSRERAMTPGMLALQQGDISLRDSQALIAKLDLQQRQQMLPILVEQAKAQLSQTLSSARAMEARAVLDELGKASAENAEALAQRLGELGASGQFVSLIIQLIRATR